MTKLTTKEIEARNRFIRFIVWKKFKYILTRGQIEIVRKIAFLEEKRLSISAYTQYGKTFCVTIGIALLIDKGKTKVAFIGPLQEQASLLRQYMSELILRSKSLLKKAMLTAEGESRISKEASRKRMTFTNGSEYRIFSAEGEAKRIMGFGVGITDGIGIIVKDESCLIPKAANAKIGRMMGNNPEDCIFIELHNPWNSDNIAFEHTLDPKFDVTHIGWEQGVKEGRTTKKHVMEQKNEITPLEFTVLYDSNFPDEAEDSLFNLKRIKEAEERKYNFENELLELEKKLSEPHKYSESEIKIAKIDIQKYTRIVSCDPAEQGLDETVIFWGVEKENKFQLVGYYSEPKSEPMDVVGRVIDKMEEYIGRKVKGLINIDRIGIGSGAFSRLKEVILEKGYKNVKVIGCHYGETAMKKDIYANKKAENYFRLQALFNEEMISILELKKLKKQLIAMRFKRTSSNKKIIIDPDDSPDWGDCLVYFIWKDRSSLTFAFA